MINVVKTAVRNVPFVEAHHMGGKQKPTLIVLRLSNTTPAEGAALGIANMWHKSNSPTDSCHYVVDEAKTYQCVPDNVASEYYIYDGVKGAITINICTEPIAYMQDWNDEAHSKVLARTVGLVSQLLHTHRIPARYLSSEQQASWLKWRKRSRGGMVLQVIGEWPRYEFLSDVQESLAMLRGKSL